MDLTDIPVFAALRTKMSYLNARNKVLAQNVANADTPGYAARDLAPLDFGAVLAKRIAPARNPASAGEGRIALRSASAAPSAFRPIETPDPDASINGNAVSLEDQMLKVNDSQFKYQTAASLYRKSLQMMRTALSRGGE